MKQDKRSHTDSEAKTGQGTEKTYNSLGSPAESPVLLYRITHLITIGLGLPTYLINLQTIESKVH